MKDNEKYNYIFLQRMCWIYWGQNLKLWQHKITVNLTDISLQLTVCKYNKFVNEYYKNSWKKKEFSSKC